MEISNILGHNFKVRGANFTGDMQGKFLLKAVSAWSALDGEYLERVARGDGGDR